MVRKISLENLKKRSESQLEKRLSKLARELSTTMDKIVEKGKAKIGYTRTKEYKNLMDKARTLRDELKKTSKAREFALDRWVQMMKKRRLRRERGK